MTGNVVHDYFYDALRPWILNRGLDPLGGFNTVLRGPQDAFKEDKTSFISTVLKAFINKLKYWKIKMLDGNIFKSSLDNWQF